MNAQTMIELNNGVQIPQLGFGTFRVSEEVTQQVTEEAFKAGYRHIDTAAGYYNEAGVGNALKASGLAREDVFITTKLRNGDQGYDNALAAFENSRAALGVDVIDLYLIHWPVPSKGLAGETWKAFEKLYADGAVRAIGVSNFMPHHLEELIANSDIVPAVNQFEIHPTLQQREAQDACRRHGVAIEAYGPIGQGEDLSLPAIVDIAAAHGVTPAQVVLRWHIQEGRIAIPKSNTPSRIAENVDIFGFELSPEQVAAIDALEAGNRMYPDPDAFANTQYRS